MNSRRLLFPLLVLLVAGVFWWLGSESTESRESAGAVPVEQSSEDRARARSLSEILPSPGASRRSSEPSMQALPAEGAAPASRAPDASQLTVEVVGPDGHRFALRSIFFGYSEAPEDRERLASLMENWSVKRSRGEYGRIRSEGRKLSLPAELPPFEQDVTLFAMTRDSLLRGTLELAAGEIGERQLVLDATSRIIVHVIDTNGADVTGVALRLWGSAAKPLASGESSSSGRLAMSLPTGTTEEDRQSLRVEVLQPLGARVELPVASEDFEARREVQIEVPVTGAIEVVLGAGFEGLTGHVVQASLRRDWGSAPLSFVLRPGHTKRVEHVGLNQTLRVAYKLSRSGVRVAEVADSEGFDGLVFSGPTEARPVVEVRLERVPDYLEFRGRLIDASGLPSRLRAHVQALSGSEGASSKTQMLTVKPSGEFQLIWGDPDPEQRRTRQLVFAVDLTAFAIVDVPGPDGRGVVDGIVELGEIALSPMSIVVAGRVVDSRGAPVVGANVCAHPVMGDPVTGWVQASGALIYVLQTQEDGRFLIPSAPQSDWWMVEAWIGPLGEPSQRGVLERVALGAEDLVIELPAE